MPRVRATAVSLRPELPASFVARHAHDPDRRVRTALARRPDLPAAWVLALATDSHAEVRAAVALREGLRGDTMKSARSPALLVTLGGDPEASVRLAVFYNRSTPDRLKRALAEDRGVQSLRAYW
jgi:hypothetical protein